MTRRYQRALRSFCKFSNFPFAIHQSADQSADQSTDKSTDKSTNKTADNKGSDSTGKTSAGQKDTGTDNSAGQDQKGTKDSISADAKIQTAKTESADLKSVKNVEAAVLKNKNSDKDRPDSTFSPMQVKASKATKKTIKLSWKKISGARYLVYGNACGRELLGN